MLFHSHIVTLLAVVGSFLVFHGQLAVAMPLKSDRTVIATTRTNHDAKPWFITRSTRSPEIETPNNSQNEDPATTTIHLLSPNSPTSNALRNTKTIARQLHRRASDVLSNNTFLTAMFALLIVLSVLLGVGIASIAVCGFDWRRYLARSETRKDLEKPEEAGAPNAS